MIEAEKHPPKVSAVILCWNRRESIKKTLEVLNKETYPAIEVIVVDNGSTDGGPELIEKEYPEVKLIRFPENAGVYAQNIGFETARGKYILILDDDSYPLSECITKSVEELEKNQDIACITAQIINPGNTIQWPEENHETPHDSFCFIGCGAIIRKDLFKKVGYYPSDYFLFHNELATSLRLLNLGYKIRYYPEIKCFHESPPSERMDERRIYYLVRNGSWNIWQFMPFRHLIYYYPGFILQNLWLSIKYRSLAGFLGGWFASYRKFFEYAIRKREACNKKVYIDRIQRRFKK